MLTFHDIHMLLNDRIKVLRAEKDKEASAEMPDWCVVNTYVEVIKELENFRSEILRRHRNK